MSTLQIGSLQDLDGNNMNERVLLDSFFRGSEGELNTDYLGFDIQPYDGDYDYLEMEIFAISGGFGTDIEFRVATNTGSTPTWITTNDYSYISYGVNNTGAFFGTNSTGGDSIKNSISSNTTGDETLRTLIFDPYAAAPTHFEFSGALYSNRFRATGAYNPSTKITFVSLHEPGGDLTSIGMSLYGRNY